jgi:glucose-1-phosphate cytidylyltransferase
MIDVSCFIKIARMVIHQNIAEPQKVTFFNTGESIMIGGRLKRVLNYLSDEDFCFSYYDCVCYVNIDDTCSTVTISVWQNQVLPC